MLSTHDLRRATRADALGLARARCASLIELGLLDRTRAADFERLAEREIGDMLANGILEAWVLLADGDVAGCACVIYWQRLPYPEASLHAELAGVYVAPTHRRRGLAGTLCRAAAKAARGRGVRSIIVHPSTSGRHIYQKMGFIDTPEMRLATRL